MTDTAPETYSSLPMVDVVDAKIIVGTVVKLTFSDGVEKTVDLSTLMFGPVYQEIMEKGMFEDFVVDPNIGTLVWPNGADIAPETLRLGVLP
jgi:hypothetical protein